MLLGLIFRFCTRDLRLSKRDKVLMRVVGRQKINTLNIQSGNGKFDEEKLKLGWDRARGYFR